MKTGAQTFLLLLSGFVVGVIIWSLVIPAIACKGDWSKIKSKFYSWNCNCTSGTKTEWTADQVNFIQEITKDGTEAYAKKHSEIKVSAEALAKVSDYMTDKLSKDHNFYDLLRGLMDDESNDVTHQFQQVFNKALHKFTPV